MSKILIVEDEESIADLEKDYLELSGFEVEIENQGDTGLVRAVKEDFDLLILDLMLPEIGGYELLEYIHPMGIPAIVISAMGRVEDRIRGLRMGADDYLCKPFQIGELLARVESVLRRTGAPAQKLQIGDVTIDPESRQVWKAGEPVELTVKEFDLLLELVRHKNVALSRASLYEIVWQEEYTGETRTLDSHIQRLRRKLDWNDRIQTVFRIGYRLEVRR